MNNLGQKIKDFRKLKGMSMPVFSGIVGIPKDRIYKWEKGVIPYETNDLQRVLDYIENGINPHDQINDSKLSEPSEPYHIGRNKRKNEREWQGVPVYEASPITATNTEVYHDERVDQPDFYLKIPQLKDCNYAARARGDSMHPKISNGDIVIGRELSNISVILFGEIYIVHTKNGIETVKYIHPDPHNELQILLVPANEKAKTTPINKNEILRIFEYRAVFKL